MVYLCVLLYLSERILGFDAAEDAVDFTVGDFLIIFVCKITLTLHPSPPSPFKPINMSRNDAKQKEEIDEEDDEYTQRIKRTGCYEQHMRLLDCHFETKDFRKCRVEMAEFKDCFSRNSSSQIKNKAS